MNVKESVLHRIQALCHERNTTIDKILECCDIYTPAAEALRAGDATDLFIEDLEQICEVLGTNLADFFHDDVFLK